MEIDIVYRTRNLHETKTAHRCILAGRGAGRGASMGLNDGYQPEVMGLQVDIRQISDAYRAIIGSIT